MKTGKIKPPYSNVTDELVVKVLDDFPLSQVPKDQYQSLIIALQRHKEPLVREHRYLEAQHIEDLCERIQKRITKSQFKQMINDKNQTLNQRLKQAQKEHQDSILRRQQIERDFEDAKQKSLDELDREHDYQLAKFDQEVYPNMPQGFKKNSPEYLQLKKQEEYMVNCKRYSEANEFKEKAEQLGEIEAQENEKRWINHVIQLREALIARQQIQRQGLEEKWERKWVESIPKAIDEEVKCSKAVKAIQSRLKMKPGPKPKRKTPSAPLKHSPFITSVRGNPSHRRTYDIPQIQKVLSRRV